MSLQSAKSSRFGRGGWRLGRRGCCWVGRWAGGVISWGRGWRFLGGARGLGGGSGVGEFVVGAVGSGVGLGGGGRSRVEGDRFGGSPLIGGMRRLCGGLANLAVVRGRLPRAESRRAGSEGSRGDRSGRWRRVADPGWGGGATSRWAASANWIARRTAKAGNSRDFAILPAPVGFGSPFAWGTAQAQTTDPGTITPRSKVRQRCERS